MIQSDREDKDHAKDQSASTHEPEKSPNDSALVSGLERLAFRLHDLGNRLLALLK